uniref:Uncharacterized protein n=1 Tax=Anguilla anguilla TaxID=7936 RepID=A0A0E9PQM5_ANGAN
MCLASSSRFTVTRFPSTTSL